MFVANERHRNAIADERRLLGDLRAALVEFDRSSADIAVIAGAEATLDQLFLLVVVGEFNAGKSAVINALVGERVSKEGILPTTASVTMLRYGPVRAERSIGEAFVEIDHPSEFLKNITIVDTPGTNAIVREHEEITERFAPKADLVLFVTSADRPLTESERLFIERLRSWAKPVVAVLNKTDLLGGPDDIATVSSFISNNIRALLGFEPTVIPVSAKLASAALDIENRTAREELDRLSGFAALRRFVFESLDEPTRLHYKLASPLGIVQSVLQRFSAAIGERRAVLADDIATDANLEAQLKTFRSDMLRDFERRSSSIDTIILEMNARASRFFETTIRLSRIPDLLNSSRVKEEFARDVIGESAQHIDDAVREIIDWSVDAQARMWTDITDYLSARRATEKSAMIGSVGGASFTQDRRAVLNQAVESTRSIVDARNRDVEAARLAASLRDAVAQTGLVGAGAVGLGVVVVTAIGGAAADITGILAGVIIAALGLYILPARRRAAQARFERESEAMRETLDAAMRAQYVQQLDAALENAQAALLPYRRFVRTERDRVDTMHRKADEIRSRAEAIRFAIA
jgi:small GTP-binding protein